MDSLVGYGSDDDNETERVGHHSSVGQGMCQPSGRRRDDDTNYDDVNMDLSEESQGGGSETDGPPTAARHCPDRPERLKRPRQDRQDSDRSNSDDSRERDRDRDRNRVRDRDRDREQDRKDRKRESPTRTRPDRERGDRDKERRSPRRDEKNNRSDRAERNRGSQDSARRGLLGDRPDEKGGDNKVPALMDLKPFGGEPPPGYGKSQDARDAVSPRFVDRDRRERDRDGERDKDRERDRDRHSRRSEERRSGHKHGEHRSRSRGAAFPPPSSHSFSERRSSPSSGDYRPSSYKVNKKLEAMEKMGLQIKTPNGSMATAQQLRAAAGESPSLGGLPPYFNPGALNSNKLSDQIQKRKLLWSSKNKSEAEEAAKWSGTRFAQDSDGKQVSKFMRLMGIKEPAAIKPTAPDATADPNKKQEELFQAMQAQYEVARATTHTMRGVGLGFQRGQF